MMATGTELLAQKVREPLPIGSVASYRSFVRRTPVDLSPDGEWVTYTVAGETRLDVASTYHSPSGVPFFGTYTTREVWVTNTRTGETVKLGKPARSSWAAVWSPDGQRLAFYADWSGTAGLWVWDKATRQLSQVMNVIVRPLQEFDVMQWTSDGRRVLSKILPEGMTVGEANRLYPSMETSRFPRVDEDAPSVFVLRSAAETTERDRKQADIEESEWTNQYFADLALIDVRSGQVRRIAELVKPLWYSFSPDERHIAYVAIRGYEANSQQGVHDLFSVDVQTGAARKLAANIRLGFAFRLSWSPDGKYLGYVTSGPRAAGDCYIVPVDGGPPRKVGGDRHPNFGGFSQYRPPLWDADGENLYLLGEGNLWKIEVKTGRAVEVARIPNRKMTGILALRDKGKFWSPDKGRSIVVNTFDDQSVMSGFRKIDLQPGEQVTLLEENRHYETAFTFDASADGRRLILLAEDAQSPPDLWLADAELRSVRRVTNLNPDFDKYEMGASRLIEWTGIEGEKLRGAVLLPAGYQEGARYPLVVWVYGGAYGSRQVNRFGFWGDFPVFNMQVLATRGYAVLFPDTPQRKGTPMKDLLHTVMPGVNKAIELGIADPDLLAVMGQSYGSYCVLALITQTNRFKAAVVTAVVDANLTSSYLFMNRDGTAGSLGYFEEGQGGMGGTLWQYRDRFIENSPVFYFDRVQTPLLMAHGTKDATPLSYPDHIFVALRRLGKEVEYRQYENEDHVISRRANVIDFWNRTIAWLDEHLGRQVVPAQ
jgi:dipeptidyl aminopeptidase/acylaminoacyl peptidase